MDMRDMTGLWPVSALTLGGGGLGQLWGETTREEAIETVRLAADRGITLIDLAPAYGRGEAEEVAGHAFDGRWPDGIRVTTKHQLGTLPVGDVLPKLERSLTRSLASMKREQVDLFFLHSNICPDGYVFEQSEMQNRWATDWTTYTEGFIPAVEALKAKGLIGAWGITGIGLPVTVMEALRADEKPQAVQAITNLLDSAGAIRRFEEPAEPRNIIRTAANNDVAVMGIRAVQAGALTAGIDRELPEGNLDLEDFVKARPFRELCQSWGEDPALIAHRYALGMEHVATVVLGVKNREELEGCLRAEAEGPLEADRLEAIEALGLRRQIPRMPLEERDV